MSDDKEIIPSVPGYKIRVHDEIKAAEKRGAERMMKLFLDGTIPTYDIDDIQGISIDKADMERKLKVEAKIWEAFEKEDSK